MIRTVRLRKTFGATVALSDVGLEIARGECVGLTGPNGGGRTTLLRLLATLVRPSAGVVEIDGLDLGRHAHEVRSRIAFVGGEGPTAEGLRVREYLSFVADARGGRGRVDDALERAKLPADRFVAVLSAGLRQRVALAAALLIAPEVLLLDGPFHALDPDVRDVFTDWLRETRDRGATIVVALNDDTMTRTLCHRVARLDQGRLVSDARVAPLEFPGAPLGTLAMSEA